MASAKDAYDGAPEGNHVIGWQVDGADRAALLARFPARHARPVADHVTLRSRVAADAPQPAATRADIVGRADDGTGVEAMVVRIEGTTARPDGGTYHITWSLAEGREARESNKVIAERGWEAFDTPIPVRLLPGIWPR